MPDTECELLKEIRSTDDPQEQLQLYALLGVLHEKKRVIIDEGFNFIGGRELSAEEVFARHRGPEFSAARARVLSLFGEVSNNYIINGIAIKLDEQTPAIISDLSNKLSQQGDGLLNNLKTVLEEVQEVQDQTSPRKAIVLGLSMTVLGLLLGLGLSQIQRFWVNDPIVSIEAKLDSLSNGLAACNTQKTNPCSNASVSVPKSIP